MAVYAIGDLQGCYAPFMRLLEQLDFDAGRDRLLLTGDLVNRGPDSLACLRYVKSLGSAATTVLGNHDLHLLALAAGGRTPGPQDTLSPILEAPDKVELLGWLGQQALAYQDSETGVLLVHAGIPPQWSAAETLEHAAEASACIRSAQGTAFFEQMYGNQPDLWGPDLVGTARIRFIINGLTRLRYCDSSGRLDLRSKGPPGTQPAGYLPWFQVPGRGTSAAPVVFGHWSSIGRTHWVSDNVWALDSGCVWGSALTALNLQTGELTRTECREYPKPEFSQD